jgi:hypothetical protein
MKVSSHASPVDGGFYATGAPSYQPPAEPLPCKLRVAVAKSILDQRPASPLTCELAIRALLGWDVVAESGVL